MKVRRDKPGGWVFDSLEEFVQLVSLGWTEHALSTDVVANVGEIIIPV